MKEYTDDQLKKVAEWLGITWKPWHWGSAAEWRVNGELICYCHSDIDPNFSELSRWLLSTEGRCAIEDKFANESAMASPPMFLKGGEWGYTLFVVEKGDMCRAVADGDTPAEAWLSAAVNYVETMRET